MEVNDGTVNSGTTAELPFSFQEELAATLQRALGVAVEIAVVEITQLLERALRGARTEVREALRDSGALKLRLKNVESQLSSVSGRRDQPLRKLESGLPVNDNANLLPRTQRGCRQLNNSNVETGRKPDFDVCEPRNNSSALHGGRACRSTQQNVDSLVSTHYLHETPELTDDQRCLNNPDESFAGTVLIDESSLEVNIKVEKEEDDPVPVSLLLEEEPDATTLSLAQSRLLEDWRPEHLQPESSCQSSDQPLDLEFLSSSGLEHQVHFLKHHNHHKSTEGHLYPQSPYHCGTCGRGFNRKQHLKIHQRIHTGERPYTCSICSARFRHALTLKRHSRIHTGEKPYTCSLCGKSFRTDGGLKGHQCCVATAV